MFTDFVGSWRNILSFYQVASLEGEESLACL